jgi:hypothetical protein
MHKWYFPLFLGYREMRDAKEHSTNPLAGMIRMLHRLRERRQPNNPVFRRLSLVAL